MENETTHTLSSELLSTVAQLLQLAILTGTDLYDHLQTLQVVTRDGKVYVSDAYREKLEQEIARLSAQAESLSSQQLQLGFKLSGADS